MTSIHQLLPNLSYGDAISNHALALQRLLRSWGHESEIYAQYVHEKMAGRCRRLDELRTDDRSITLYHHSIGSIEVTALYRSMKGRRAMIYHNITPHHFFAPYRTRHHDLCRMGREELASFRDGVDMVLADSAYNGSELEALGFPRAHVLPILVDFDRLDETAPDFTAVSGLGDDWTCFLFVGRISPNKRQEDVIRAFGWYHRFINRRSRLFLVGDHGGMGAYLQDLREVVASLDLDGQVMFSGRTSLGELLGYYRRADLFLCMSEHEGFCVPLLEAMHHDIPILAYASSAVPETLGEAGVLLTGKDMPVAAEMAHLMTSDGPLREKILAGQRRRLEDFKQEAVGKLFRSYIDQLL